MRTATEVFLTLLAATGLWLLLWLLFGRLLTPAQPLAHPVYAVIPATGDGVFLEHHIRHLLWLQNGKLANFTILVVDNGLSETGRAQAEALQAQEPAVLFCSMQDLTRIIKT